MGLAMMINGAIGGMRTLLWSIFLISLPLYCVALMMRESLDFTETANGVENFSTLADAFFTMFRCIVATECNTREGKPIFVLLVSKFGWGYGLIYCLTMVFMTFGLFNVIVALYVENTVEAAK